MTLVTLSPNDLATQVDLNAVVSRVFLLESGELGEAAILAGLASRLAAVEALVHPLPPPPPPPSGGVWPHAPVGWTTLTDYGFSDAPILIAEGMLGTSGWKNVYIADVTRGWIAVVPDASAPESPPSVLQFLYPIGRAGGAAPATVFYNIPTPPSALYVGFWWKPSNPWQGHISGVNKIMFINLGPAGIAVGNLTMQLWGMGTGPFATRMVGEGFQDVAYWENVGSTKPLALGQWHRIEILMNSPVGALQWWVDGVLIGNYAGIPYPVGGFEQLQFSPTWGGNGDVKTENDFFWVDHVYVSHP